MHLQSWELLQNIGRDILSAVLLTIRDSTLHAVAHSIDIWSSLLHLSLHKVDMLPDASLIFTNQHAFHCAQLKQNNQAEEMSETVWRSQYSILGIETLF